MCRTCCRSSSGPGPQRPDSQARKVTVVRAVFGRSAADIAMCRDRGLWSRRLSAAPGFACRGVTAPTRQLPVTSSQIKRRAGAPRCRRRFLPRLGWRCVGRPAIRLRICPKDYSTCRALWHDLDHGEFDQGLGGSVEMFDIAGKTAVAPDAATSRHAESMPLARSRAPPARSGGSRWSPTMSVTFSSNMGAFETLKDVVRCGFGPACAPYAAHARRQEAHGLGHGATAPTGGVRRGFPHRHRHHLQARLPRQRRHPRRPDLVAPEAIQAFVQVPLLPAPDRGFGRVRAPHDLSRAVAIRRRQHDLRSPHELARGVPVCGQGRVFGPVSGARVKADVIAPPAPTMSRPAAYRTPPPGVEHQWSAADMRCPVWDGLRNL